MRRNRLAAIVLLTLAGPAAAQAPAPEPASAGTPEGAKAVLDGLAAYVGRTAIEKGLVKVEPDPAGYRLILDPASFLKDLSINEFGLEIAPIASIISQRGDGNWNYFSNADLDMNVRIVEGGQEQRIAYDFGPHVTKGVYSPALATFLSAIGTIDSMALTSTQDQGEVTAKFDDVRVEQTGKPAADGAADVTANQTFGGFEEVIRMKPGPEMPANGFDVTIKAASLQSTAAITAARTRHLLDLVAFFVAHPEYTDPKTEKAKLVSGQAELKDKLRSVLPLWGNLNGTYVMKDFSAGSQMGGVTAKDLSFDFGADGVSRAGVVSYAMRFSGLDLSSPAIPSWAPALIPQEAELRFKLDNLDLQTPADIALADLDLGRDEPLSADAQTRIGESFTNNPPRFIIEPSRLKSRDLDLTMAGSMVVSDGRPAVSMDITAAGIDKAISTLQAAAQSDPDINQAVGGLSIAKGFGKTLPDGRTQWIIDAASDGSVKVNGFEVKPADPVIVPDADGSTSDGDVAPGIEPPADEAPTDDNASPQP